MVRGPLNIHVKIVAVLRQDKHLAEIHRML